MEETGVPGENHRTAAVHWQMLYRWISEGKPNTGHKTLDIQNCQKMLGWYYDDGTDSNNGNLRLN